MEPPRAIVHREAQVFKRWIGKLAGSTRSAGRATVRLLERELSILAREVMLVRGLLPLVARQRDGGWSAPDKAQLRIHLWRVFRISCCMVLLVLPGSFVFLPLIAAGREWSRNRSPRPAGEAGPNAADA
jgi:hypothetical protein